MSKVPAATELTVAQRATLDSLLAADELDITRAESHLFAMLPPHEQFVWHVDLDVPEFTSKIGDDLHVRSEAQLIATHSSEDGTWLWGDRNPSTPPVGVARIAAALDAIPELRELRAVARFPLDEGDARRLAQVCAVRGGALGAWPAPVGVATAYLALDPTVWPDSPAPVTDRRWCSMCGRTRDQCEALIAGPGVSVCDACVGLFDEIIADAEPPADPDAVEHEFMPPCLLCGGKTRRVFGANGGVCHKCIAAATSALTPK